MIFRSVLAATKLVGCNSALFFKASGCSRLVCFSGVRGGSCRFLAPLLRQR